MEALSVAAILGVRAVDLGELSRKVERGLPKNSLVRVAERVAVRKGDAGRLMYRVVPEATFKRRIRLSPQESERTERLARVIAGAEMVWGNREDAREWLHAAHPELDGRSPIDAAMTELGARRVEAILNNIFYGLPA